MILRSIFVCLLFTGVCATAFASDYGASFMNSKFAKATIKGVAAEYGVVCAKPEFQMIDGKRFSATYVCSEGFEEAVMVEMKGQFQGATPFINSVNLVFFN